MGVRLRAARRAASVSLKFMVLVFEQESVTLELLSWGSPLPCQNFGLICLKKQRVSQSPRPSKTLQRSACLPLPSEAQCGLFIASSGRKASLFLCLCGVCGTRLCQTTRQRLAVIELGENRNESRGIWVGGGEAASASTGPCWQSQHTERHFREQVPWLCTMVAVSVLEPTDMGMSQGLEWGASNDAEEQKHQDASGIGLVLVEIVGGR